MSWSFGLEAIKYCFHNKGPLLAVGGAAALSASIVLTDYLTSHYFEEIFDRTRSKNTRQLVEMRDQVSTVFNQLHEIGARHLEQESGCGRDLFEVQATLVDANRFIYETAVDVGGGRLCTSYGAEFRAMREFAFEETNPGYQFRNGDLVRTYWFNAGQDTNFNTGEIIVREKGAHLRINKGILLDALALDERLAFGLFERGSPEALLSNQKIEYSPEAVTNPETIVHGADAVVYSYPVKWTELVALIAVPTDYYKKVWVGLLILCSVGVAVFIGLILYLIKHVYLLKFSLQAKLRSALRGSQLQMLYQPIVDMRTGQVVGAEALMRWHLDDRKISPAEFIPLAETNGLITDLTLWCCEQVAKELSVLLSYSEDKYVSINLSSVALSSSDIARRLHLILSRYAIRPSQFVFEITESFTVAGEFAESQLFYLREMGYRIALDDFGTGNSNLVYLEQLPVDIIKIDKSFVTPDKMYSSDAMWWHIISIARSLDMVIIAEGIEGVDQVEPLLSAGVRYAQGYYYYKPTSAEAVLKLMGGRQQLDVDRSGLVSRSACKS